MSKTKMTIKKRGYGLEMKMIQGENGMYLFVRERDGVYHTFVEVAAKEAARDCGAKPVGDTRQLCKEVWNKK